MPYFFPCLQQNSTARIRPAQIMIPYQRTPLPMGMATGSGLTDQSPNRPGKLMGISVLAYSYIVCPPHDSLGQTTDSAARSGVMFSRRNASTSAFVTASKTSGNR